MDPRYPTNRTLLYLLPGLLLVGALWTLANGGGWVEAAMGGVDLGLLAFVCWAFTRELDPDGEIAGLLALAPAAAAWTVWSGQSILVPAALLISARLVNRTTGKAAEPSDTLLVAVGFLAAGWWVSWSLALVGAGALLLDGALAPPEGQPRRRHHLWVGAVVLAGSAPVWIDGFDSISASSSTLTALVGGAVAGAVLASAPAPVSVGDLDGAPLQPLRVRLAGTLGVLGLVLVGLDPSLEAAGLAASWSCVAVAALAAVNRRIRSRG